MRPGRHVRCPEGNQTKTQDSVSVLVAVTPLQPGEPLDENKNVTFKPWPKELVPPGAVTKLDQIKNRAMKMPVEPGEVCLLSKLGEPGVYSASSEIPEGMRLASVKVDPTMTHSGLMMPGDFVDVLVTYSMINPKTRKPVNKTKTVLELIKVFATDNIRASAAVSNNQGQSDTAAKYVSLLVTPEQAKWLTLAQKKGELQLMLRPKGDMTLTRSDKIDEFMFDEEETLAGEGDESLADNDDHSNRANDVASFLEAAEKPEAHVEVEKPVEVIPEKPQWKIVIFKGEEKVEEFVDLPEEKIELLEAPTETPSVDSAAVNAPSFETSSVQDSWWSAAFSALGKAKSTQKTE
ncbi:MAG: Flp pilus assembly protein CpaB [Planctomycetota bacterium]|nr:Flp pilus assembly protein CpaB [Planctomycetota bacterium]